MSLSIYFPSPINYLADGLNLPLGGAEKAVLFLSTALAAHGVQVEVSSKTHATFTHSETLLVQRFPLAVKRYRPAFRSVYFSSPDDTSHGAIAALRNTQNLAEFNQLVDGVLAISNYQAQRLVELGIEERKIMPFRWGVDTRSFPVRSSLPEPVCIYTSSPRRGLHLLLDIWPVINAAVPTARLWLYSSMRTYRKSDRTHEGLYARLRTLPNTTVHEPVGQAELVTALSRARVLLYPNTYNETASLAVMEAVAAGCAVVTADAGALPETALGNVFVGARRDPQSLIHAYADRTIDLLTNDNLFLAISKRNQLRAQYSDWTRVAEELIILLKLR